MLGERKKYTWLADAKKKSILFAIAGMAEMEQDGDMASLYICI